MTKIIAFAGKKQSGKTTASELVRDIFLEYNPKETVQIYNFADPLKQDICINLFGLTHDQCYGNDDQKNEITDLEWEGKKLSAREVMQFVGTDIFRKMKHNIWADATINKITRDKPSLAIIADCRFPNEVETVKKHGGIVIKLNRNPHGSTHESETALDSTKYNQRNFDIVVFNNDMSLDHKNYTIIKFLDKKGILRL